MRAVLDIFRLGSSLEVLGRLSGGSNLGKYL